MNSALNACDATAADEGDDADPLLASLRREAGLQAAVRHPNVVSLMAVCFEPPTIVSEYYSRGSLLDVLQAARQSLQVAAELSWVRRCNMVRSHAGFLPFSSYRSV